VLSKGVFLDLKEGKVALNSCVDNLNMFIS
jgi:hypothetical protein